MDNQLNKKYSPISIWILLALATVCLCTWIYFTEKADRIFENASMDKYIRKELEVRNSRPLVLIIGTSLVESGLDVSDSISSRIQRATGRNIRVIKIWKDASRPSAIIDHLPALQELKPDLVVVQANILFYLPADEAILSRYAQTFRDMLAFKNRRIPYAPDFQPKFRPQEISSVDKMRNGLADTADLSSFRRLAMGWRSKGSHFLFINFPIEATLEQKKWNSPDTTIFYRNLNYLKEKIPLVYINDHLKLDSSCFFDYAHLNKKGSTIFSAFFCYTLADQIRKL